MWLFQSCTPNEKETRRQHVFTTRSDAPGVAGRGPYAWVRNSNIGGALLDQLVVPTSDLMAAAAGASGAAATAEVGRRTLTPGSHT